MTSAATRFNAEAQIQRGALALVVGPSGAGKDTLITAVQQMLGEDERLSFARRVVTRTSDDATESHDSMTRPEFDTARSRGAFLLSWEAHGLGYAIPIAAAQALRRSQVVVANVSRTTILSAEQIVGRVVVFHVTAPVDILASRIAARGREPMAEVASRIARQAPLVTGRAEIIEIVNDGSIDTAASLMAARLKRIADETAGREL